MRVQHRHIIYIQGYDPRGLAQYYRMFRTELRKFARLYQLSATMSRPQDASDGEIASWTIETKADDWQTRANYDFLRFEDFIQRDLASPIWRTVFHAVWIYWRLVFAGTIARFWRAQLALCHLHHLPAFRAAAGGGVCGGTRLCVREGTRRTRHAGSVQYCGGGRGVRCDPRHRAEIYRKPDLPALSAVRHDLDLGILAPRSAPIGTRASTASRSTSSRSRAQATPKKSSLSATVPDRSSAPKCWRAPCKLDPALGRHGPRIVLLTIGGNFPIVGFHAASKDFRDHLRMLAVEPSIDWIDCQSRKDVMNFYPFDPIEGHGIDVGEARRNPTIVPVRFRDIIRPEHYNVFRWKFFRVHFQFVMANERPHAYDFFMIVCGPIPLSARMAVPEAALAVATGDPAAREWAWKRIETARTGPVDAADSGELEPSARRSG